MILFFGDPESKVFALETNDELDNFSIEKLNWVLNAPFLNKQTIENSFLGPKSTMISPWSTNAVEIINNMGILSVVRIEEFLCIKANQTFVSDSLARLKPISSLNSMSLSICL